MKTFINLPKVFLVLIALTAAPIILTAQPRFQISPKQPLMDERIKIRLSGLPPKAVVNVKARMWLAGISWQSSASFTANQNGIVDLSKQSPLAGDYKGIEAMGLFWSMNLEARTESNGSDDLKSIAPVVTNLTAEIKGQIVAENKIIRLWTKPEVKTIEVHENGLVGRIFEPATKGKRPGILVLSGSEGGIKNWEAAILASRGYTVFALAYFKAEGLSDELVNIPLDYLKKGIDWMRARKSVDGNRIGVMGASKGGELSLLLASMFPEIKAVVAYNSGTLIGTGIDSKRLGNESSWTYQGKPLTFARCKATHAFTSQFGNGKPLRLLPLNAPCLNDEEATKGAVIPVEKIKGAVLLVTGGDDQTGPSSLSAEMIVETLRRHKHPFPFRHLSYPSAGHGIYIFYIPTTLSTQGGHLVLGGTPEANAKAQADSWRKVLVFLRRTLTLL